MFQSTGDHYLFHVKHSAYIRTRFLGWLWCAGFLLAACLALFLSFKLIATYPHTFAPYLKWQDALVSSLWWVSSLSIGGLVLIIRLLTALNAGYSKGMVEVFKDEYLMIRDLSHENFIGIFWLINAAFWCFGVVL